MTAWTKEQERALQNLQAIVWDEGYEAGFKAAFNPEGAANPYRDAAILPDTWPYDLTEDD